MSRTRKIILSLLIVGVVAGVAGVGSYSAFTATTSNSGNSFSSGTVGIGDDDSGSAVYSASNLAPGASVTRCIKVQYTGSLTSEVRMYTNSSIGSLGPYINLKIERGDADAGSYSSCSGFSSAGTVYNDTLSKFATDHSGWSNGLAMYNIQGLPQWNAAYTAINTGVYKITATLADNANANGLTTGSHTFTWEARSL